MNMWFMYNVPIWHPQYKNIGCHHMQHFLDALTYVAPLFATSAHYRKNRPELANPVQMKADVQKYQADRTVFVLKDDDGKPVAAAICFGVPGNFLSPPRFWIQHLVVDESTRRGGLGTQMIEVIIRNLPKSYPRVGFGVRTGNKPMLGFAAKRGFTVTSTQEVPGFGEVSFLYRDIREEDRLSTPWSGDEVLFHVELAD